MPVEPTKPIEPSTEVVKLIIQTDIVDLIRAAVRPGQSVQHWIIEHLANHFEVTPILRGRGNPSGKAKGAE